jgi:hypothetical protein
MAAVRATHWSGHSYEMIDSTKRAVAEAKMAFSRVKPARHHSVIVDGLLSVALIACGDLEDFLTNEKSSRKDWAHNRILCNTVLQLTAKLASPEIFIRNDKMEGVYYLQNDYLHYIQGAVQKLISLVHEEHRTHSRYEEIIDVRGTGPLCYALWCKVKKDLTAIRLMDSRLAIEGDKTKEERRSVWTTLSIKTDEVLAKELRPGNHIKRLFKLFYITATIETIIVMAGIGCELGTPYGLGAVMGSLNYDIAHTLADQQSNEGNSEYPKLKAKLKAKSDGFTEAKLHAGLRG